MKKGRTFRSTTARIVRRLRESFDDCANRRQRCIVATKQTGTLLSALFRRGRGCQLRFMHLANYPLRCANAGATGCNL